MPQLNQKVAVVTGSTRGLGLAIAQAYARAGASVVVSSRSPDAVARTVDSLRAEGYTAVGQACDVGDIEQVRAVAQRAVDSFGRIDIWVNNAGLTAPYGPTTGIPVETFHQVVQTNILGVYHGSVVALGHMLPRQSGKLINLVGAGARRPVPFQSAYGSSKAWVRNFSLALATEYKASGVGVYVFSPGLVTTEMLSDVKVVPGFETRVRALETVVGLWGNPPEVPAQKAVWIASAATDGRTGVEINVLTRWKQITGLVKAAARRVTGQPTVPFDLHVTPIQPSPHP